MGIPRRTFLAGCGGAAALLSAPASRRALAATTTETERRRRLQRWVLDFQIAPSGLCRYYRFGPHQREESPLATAYAILLLNDDYPDAADRLVDALIALQQTYASNRHVGGGVPSIANDDSRMFYASDALASTKAILRAYKRNGRSEHLRAATGFVEFVRRMADGQRHGFLLQNLDFPMQYVTPSGQYQNWLVPNVAMLFWDALRDYAQLAADASAAALFERGRTFLLGSAQASSGAYYDHYDPGYPPQAYSPERWRWFKEEPGGRCIAIGDNTMMSALGAQRMADRAGVGRFLRWAKPTNGAFYAYIDVATVGSGFQNGDRPYFDVVASGMYRELLAQSGLLGPAALQRVFALSAGADGGYRWGLAADGSGWVQDAAEALPTGYWIVGPDQ